MVALPSSDIRVQGTADGVPTNTETGRQRKSSHGLLALRRSTTTPTTILASAVDLTPHLHPRLGWPAGTMPARPDESGSSFCSGHSRTVGPDLDAPLQAPVGSRPATGSATH